MDEQDAAGQEQAMMQVQQLIESQKTLVEENSKHSVEFTILRRNVMIIF